MNYHDMFPLVAPTYVQSGPMLLSLVSLDGGEKKDWNALHSMLESLDSVEHHGKPVEPCNLGN